MGEASITSLTRLRAAEEACTRCPLYRDATQVVPGEGPARARLLIVGEQPGDKEDLEGRPFVGPAGRILDEALAEARVDRAQTFVTNAVKHFKHEMRGKRRLHKRPNAYEIDRCHWWLENELKLLKPAGVVALGATAVRSLIGRPMTLSQARSQSLALPDGAPLIVTIHPSYLLRIRDAQEKRLHYARFVADLTDAARLVNARPVSAAGRKRAGEAGLDAIR